MTAAAAASGPGACPSLASLSRMPCKPLQPLPLMQLINAQHQGEPTSVVLVAHDQGGKLVRMCMYVNVCMCACLHIEIRQDAQLGL
jgi:hypothetical protein